MLPKYIIFSWTVDRLGGPMNPFTALLIYRQREQTAALHWQLFNVDPLVSVWVEVCPDLRVIKRVIKTFLSDMPESNTDEIGDLWEPTRQWFETLRFLPPNPQTEYLTEGEELL